MPQRTANNGHRAQLKVKTMVKKTASTTARKGQKKTTSTSTERSKKKKVTKAKTTTRILATSHNPNEPTFTPSPTTNRFFTRCSGRCCTTIVVLCSIIVLLQLNYDIEFSTYHFTNTISIQQKKTGSQQSTTTEIETGAEEEEEAATSSTFPQTAKCSCALLRTIF